MLRLHPYFLMPPPFPNPPLRPFSPKRTHSRSPLALVSASGSAAGARPTPTQRTTTPRQQPLGLQPPPTSQKLIVGGGLTHLGEGRGSSAEPAKPRQTRPSPAPRSCGRRREEGSPARASAAPGARRAESAGRARVGRRPCWGAWGEPARGAAGAKLRGPDARGRGGAARLPLLPLRAPGASPQAALPAARRVHRASEGMCGGRGWSCRRRRRASRS
ncbi:uncharacterized protein [Castor canadensis]|uniref:Uncharacterized protein n=1 Tax=Castor canadensis TaxID=51338 RepID=A0AC58LW16_CASCN